MDRLSVAASSPRDSAPPDFRDELLEAVPALRAFARSLSGRADLADDLAQETLLRAWANRKSFTPGTNLKAWLFTILRNTFYSTMRKRTREVEDPDELHARNMTVPPAQDETVELRQLQHALGRLPAEQREALILVGASGFSYEEAAAICTCAVGTMKSRVSRARRALLSELGGQEELLGAAEQKASHGARPEDPSSADGEAD